MTELDIQVRATTDKEIHALLIGASPLTPVELELGPLYDNDEPEVSPLAGVMTKIGVNQMEDKDSIAIEGLCDEPVDGHRYFKFSVWYHVNRDEIGGVLTVDSFDYTQDVSGTNRVTFPLGKLESIGVGETLTRSEVYGE